MSARPLAESLALVFTDRARRGALEALLAIEDEIEGAVRPGIEHAVAHAKLAWWRDEVDRLAAGRPLHPLSRALASGAGAAPRYALLHERLHAADLALAGFAPSTEAELLALVDRSHGAPEMLASEVLAGRTDPALADFGRRLGRGLGLLAALAAPDHPSLVHLSRAPLLEQARTALEDAAGRLPADLRASQVHGLIRAAIARARLARLARLALERQDPPALNQLWLAWRVARRASLESHHDDP